MLTRDEVHISTVASKPVNASMAPELEHEMLELITPAYAQTRQTHVRIQRGGDRGSGPPEKSQKYRVS